MFPRFLRPLAVSLICSASAFAEDAPSSVAIPVPQGGMEKRHAEKVAAIKGQRFDLLLIGDSITHNFDNAAYKAVWEQFFAARNAIGLGYSGGRGSATPGAQERLAPGGFLRSRALLRAGEALRRPELALFAQRQQVGEANFFAQTS